MIQIFYHEKDLDGWASGAIANYYHRNEKVELIPYDYYKEKELHNLLDKNAEKIYFVDCSADPKLLKEYSNIIIIDHHKSFIEKAQGYKFKGIQDINFAGCELTWFYFYPEYETPYFISLLGRYDIWDKSSIDEWNKKIMPFQMGMRLRAYNPNENFLFWKKLLVNCFSKENVFRLLDFQNKTIEEGRLILEYQSNEDTKIVKLNSFEATFEGYNVIALNHTRTNSQVFNSAWNPEKHDIIFMWYNIKGERYTVSLYTKKDDIDVSLIAKEFGGGGHKQAAGFVCNDVIINKGEITIV